MHKNIAATTLATLFAASFLSGCQTQVTKISEHLPPPPAAVLGPQFEVLKAPRYTYLISEAMDGAGRVHLIVVPRRARVGPISVA